MSKKYYLTVQQRDAVVNALLRDRIDLKSGLKPEERSQKVIEMAEEKNQEIDMLVDLFRVEETERC